MKVTKFAHSCLLVEENNQRVLIDPGIFSWREYELELSQVTQLDYLLVTHLHPDHMHIPAIKKLVSNSPQVKIVAATDAVEKLAEADIKANNQSAKNIELREQPHAELWGNMPTPNNAQFTLFDKLTHVGDTHEIVETADVLAIPVYAPWGSTKNAIAAILESKPKKVIPIHDWFWSSDGRDWHYDLLESNLGPAGIELLRPIEKEVFAV